MLCPTDGVHSCTCQSTLPAQPERNLAAMAGDGLRTSISPSLAGILVIRQITFTEKTRIGMVGYSTLQPE